MESLAAETGAVVKAAHGRPGADRARPRRAAHARVRPRRHDPLPGDRGVLSAPPAGPGRQLRPGPVRAAQGRGRRWRRSCCSRCFRSRKSGSSIDLVAERGLAGLEIERAGFRLRIEGPRPAAARRAPAAPRRACASPPVRGAPWPRRRRAEAAADENVHVITSPIVGTFYRSPSPEADRVRRGRRSASARARSSASSSR